MQKKICPTIELSNVLLLSQDQAKYLQKFSPNDIIEQRTTETNRQKDKQTERQANRQTSLINTLRKTDGERQIDRHVEIQKLRKTERQRWINLDNDKDR